MNEYEKIQDRLNRHERYIMAKDSNVLIHYGVEPYIDRISMSITELVDLKLALEHLSDTERFIVRCNVIGGETLNVVAHQLGISRDTVIRRKKSAIEKLREYMK